MLSLLYGPTLTSVHGYWKNYGVDCMDLCLHRDALLFDKLSRFVIAFLPWGKRLLISWLQSQSAVILEPKKRKYVTLSISPPSICHEVMGSDAMILVFLNIEFQASFFTFLFHPHQEVFHFLPLEWCYRLI